MPIISVIKNTLGAIGGLSRKSKIVLAWDVFMVWVAVINLWMILFDLSYLWLRPQYVTYLPVVSNIYDPVKGIEPHPLTDALRNEIEITSTLIEESPYSPIIEEHRDNIVELTYRVISENAFARSGQAHTLGYMSEALARNIGVTGGALRNPDTLRDACEEFWPTDPDRLAESAATIDPRVIRGFELNYYRTFNVNGKLTDHFWILDLPFLILFWIEFNIRWFLAVKRKTYSKWFFFPIFNWYDVLGLIPVSFFRPFRLLRAVSMYMRLRRSELSNVGKDVFTRTVLYFSNIITEEVSDRVAMRILTEYHEEVSQGTQARIIQSVVEPRKPEIEGVIVSQLRQTLTDPTTIDRLRTLVQLNLANAIDESEALQAVPLPNMVIKPAVRAIGEVILDTTLETVAGTLDSPEGEEAVREVASAILDDVFYGPGLAQADSLVKEITLHVLEHMMDVVKVQKWALPEDQSRRPPMPWEPGALDEIDPGNETEMAPETESEE